jgi:diacylglycerol kinase family enzyme
VRIELMTNPASGSGTDGDDVAARLRAAGAEIVEDGAERVVVSGGDGTIVAGAERAAALGVPLAVLPAGTANDFARANGIPLDLDAAARLAVTGMRTSPHDLGRIDGRGFLTVAAAGLAPAAARRAAPLKRALGPLAYPVGGLLAGLREAPIPVSVPPHFEGRAWQVIVAITGGFGGGAGIDAADPADGRLDLVVLPAGRRAALLRHALHMRRGTLAEAPGAIHARARELPLDVPAGTPFNIDGEVVEAGPSVHVTVQVAAFLVVH